MSYFTRKNIELPSQETALPGRDLAMNVSNKHFVHGNPIVPPFPPGMAQIVFGMGCFWGAERKFWSLNGVFTTAVGYAQGITPNPTYEETCTGMTGHNEVVLVVFDPDVIQLNTLLGMFWESHNPTQGMRQGNDQGTQYRSGIYTQSDDQLVQALASKENYQQLLASSGLKDGITTEIDALKNFYYAEDYHQQYLAKNPNGYCGLGGTGVCYR